MKKIPAFWVRLRENPPEPEELLRVEPWLGHFDARAVEAGLAQLLQIAAEMDPWGALVSASADGRTAPAPIGRLLLRALMILQGVRLRPLLEVEVLSRPTPRMAHERLLDCDGDAA